MVTRGWAAALALCAATLSGTAADAACGCRVRHVAHAGARHHHAVARATRGPARGPVVDAAGLTRHAQWDVEVVPGRRVTPLDTDQYLPSPGQPGFDARVPVSLGWGGVVTPPIKLPVRRGYDGFK